MQGPRSPGEHGAITSPQAIRHQMASTIIVAVDQDRNSQLAVKWAVDYLLSGASHIVLLQVVNQYSCTVSHGFASMAETTESPMDAEMKEIFAPLRGFCNRTGVQVSEVVLEDADVSKAIVEYITANKIQSIALGGNSGNAFTKKFKNPDVPSTLMKCAPEYCNIYVVAKGKSVNVRLAKCSVPDVSTENESLKYTSRGSRGHRKPATPDAARRSVDSHLIPEFTTRPPFRERSLPSSNYTAEDSSSRRTRRFNSHDFVGDLNFSQSARFASVDFVDNLDMPTAGSSGTESMSPSTGATTDVEGEMRRLRLELKQTTDMYNAACKGAINAKKWTKELQMMKLEESRRLEEARHAEESALALAKLEKTKCRAAMEAAEAAQRLADLEVQRRRNAELRAAGVRREGVVLNQRVT